MPSVDDSEVLVSVKPPLLLAVTVSAVAALSVSDPVPVQPLTVKVLPPAVSVRLAVVIPLRVRVGMPGHRQRGIGQRGVGRHRCPPGCPAMPVSDPLPVQPVMVKVLPPDWCR